MVKHTSHGTWVALLTLMVICICIGLIQVAHMEMRHDNKRLGVASSPAENEKVAAKSVSEVGERQIAHAEDAGHSAGLSICACVRVCVRQS